MAFNFVNGKWIPIPEEQTGFQKDIDPEDVKIARTFGQEYDAALRNTVSAITMYDYAREGVGYKKDPSYDITKDDIVLGQLDLVPEEYKDNIFRAESNEEAQSLTTKYITRYQDQVALQNSGFSTVAAQVLAEVTNPINIISAMAAVATGGTSELAVIAAEGIPAATATAETAVIATEGVLGAAGNVLTQSTVKDLYDESYTVQNFKQDALTGGLMGAGGSTVALAGSNLIKHLRKSASVDLSGAAVFNLNREPVLPAPEWKYIDKARAAREKSEIIDEHLDSLQISSDKTNLSASELNLIDYSKERTRIKDDINELEWDIDTNNSFIKINKYELRSKHNKAELDSTVKAFEKENNVSKQRIKELKGELNRLPTEDYSKNLSDELNTKLSAVDERIKAEAELRNDITKFVQSSDNIEDALVPKPNTENTLHSINHTEGNIENITTLGVKGIKSSEFNDTVISKEVDSIPELVSMMKKLNSDIREPRRFKKFFDRLKVFTNIADSPLIKLWKSDTDELQGFVRLIDGDPWERAGGGASISSLKEAATRQLQQHAAQAAEFMDASTVPTKEAGKQLSNIRRIQSYLHSTGKPHDQKAIIKYAKEKGIELSDDKNLWSAVDSLNTGYDSMLDMLSGKLLGASHGKSIKGAENIAKQAGWGPQILKQERIIALKAAGETDESLRDLLTEGYYRGIIDGVEDSDKYLAELGAELKALDRLPKLPSVKTKRKKLIQETAASILEEESDDLSILIRSGDEQVRNTARTYAVVNLEYTKSRAEGYDVHFDNPLGALSSERVRGEFLSRMKEMKARGILTQANINSFTRLKNQVNPFDTWKIKSRTKSDSINLLNRNLLDTTVKNEKGTSVSDFFNDNPITDYYRMTDKFSGRAAMAQFGLHSPADFDSMTQKLLRSIENRGKLSSVERKETQELINMIRDHLTGDLSLSSDSKLLNNIRTSMNIAWLGKMGLNTIVDNYLVAAKHGTRALIRETIVNPLGRKLKLVTKDNLATGFKPAGLPMKNEYYNTRHDIDFEQFSGTPRTKFDKFLMYGHRKIGTLSGGNLVQGQNQSTWYRLTVRGLDDPSSVKGNFSSEMKRAGLTEDLQSRIKTQLNKHGKRENGTLVDEGLAYWQDTEASDAFNTAVWKYISKNTGRSNILDAPTWAHNDFGRLFLPLQRSVWSQLNRIGRTEMQHANLSEVAKGGLWLAFLAHTVEAIKAGDGSGSFYDSISDPVELAKHTVEWTPGIGVLASQISTLTDHSSAIQPSMISWASNAQRKTIAAIKSGSKGETSETIANIIGILGINIYGVKFLSSLLKE